MTLTDESFAYVADLVRRESAIVLERGKEYLVEARLLPLSRQTGAATVNEFVQRLRVLPAKETVAAVVDALTTNETFWFRDGDPFEALRNDVLPRAMEQARARRRLTIWSAACSSGQEAYSIAMLAAELVTPLGWTVEIHATDISPTMLARVDEGRYSALEVGRGLPAPLLARHFTQTGSNEFQVNDNLRAMVQTRYLNLAQPFPVLPAFDIVFLRNVLIYFDAETKTRILRDVRRVTAPGGWLFLGAAETTLGIDEAWQRESAGRASLHRKAGAADVRLLDQVS